MEPVKLPAIFNKMTPRVDKSWKIEFETRELYGEGIKNLAEMLGAEGWLVYAPNDLTQTDIPEVDADSGLDGKSPSQRLRNVLFVRWEQAGKKGSFDSWYLSYINRLIDFEKSKLDPSGR